MSVPCCHIGSYYADGVPPEPEHPRLQGEEDCDVCVVGGGLTGCTAALELAERGYSVKLVEARRIGWGASGRSGGQVLPGYACDIGKIARLTSRADARRLWSLSVEAVDRVKNRIARHGIDCDWHDGQMQVALKPRQRAELLAWKRTLEDEYGYAGLRLVEAEEIRELIATRRYIAGLLDRRSGHLHPLLYTRGIAAAAAAAGACLHEDTRATRIVHGSRPSVICTGGRIRARHVVLAGNAYIGALAPRIGRRIMPVGTYVAATEPMEPARARALIPSGIAVTDVNFVLDYFRLSADHRLLFGGKVSYSTLPPPTLKRSMRARMLKVFPQLADLRMTHAWGGLVDITMNRAPDFGRLAPNVYYAQGFSGHGMALTGLAGALMAEAVSGTAERFDLFTRIPHRSFPGGRLFRTPLLVLGMLYYRLRDFL